MRYLLALLFCASFLGVAPAMADTGCPDILKRQLTNEAPACRLLAQGVLKSQRGNSDVAYRLYRWVSSLETMAEPLYDAPPYNQVAATLGLAGNGAENSFWSGHFWLGTGWFEMPYLAINQRYGEMLIVPGRYTGSYVDDHVFMPNRGRGWTQINAAQLNQESGEGWARQLQSHLPEGSYIAKGIRLDYRSLSGESAVWRKDDANCCPTGGQIRFTLRLAGPELSFEVAEAQYTPPETAK